MLSKYLWIVTRQGSFFVWGGGSTNVFTNSFAHIKFLHKYKQYQKLGTIGDAFFELQ